MGDFVVITRPENEALDYAQELESQGFSCFVEPMLQIEDVAFEKPDLSIYDGVLLTSAQAVRAMGDGGSAAAYCVGKHTGDAARDSGFSPVIESAGTGADLVRCVAEQAQPGQRYLHVRGRDVAFPIAEALADSGVACDSLVVYAAQAVRAFSVDFLRLLEAGEIGAVTFFSKRTAQVFLRLVEKNGFEKRLGGIKVLSISDSVLECVRVFDWAGMSVCDTPDRVGMLKLLQQEFGD